MYSLTFSSRGLCPEPPNRFPNILSKTGSRAGSSLVVTGVSPFGKRSSLPSLPPPMREREAPQRRNTERRDGEGPGRRRWATELDRTPKGNNATAPRLLRPPNSNPRPIPKKTSSRAVRFSAFTGSSSAASRSSSVAGAYPPAIPMLPEWEECSAATPGETPLPAVNPANWCAQKRNATQSRTVTTGGVARTSSGKRVNLMPGIVTPLRALARFVRFFRPPGERGCPGSAFASVHPSPHVHPWTTFQGSGTGRRSKPLTVHGYSYYRVVAPTEPGYR